MTDTHVNDELQAAIRTIRLAQAQLANVRKRFANDNDKRETLESVELVLALVLNKLDGLKED
jgi:hypothetical protein